MNMSVTHTFKIGDTVRRISGSYCGMRVGDTSVVVGVDNECLKLKDFSGGQDPYSFGLVKEAPTFNLKTQPWFIRVNSKEESTLAQEWLFSQGVFWGLVMGNSDVRHSVDSGGYLTNQRIDLIQQSCIMYGSDLEAKKKNCPEIKLNFKIIIDSVVYPEVKTQQEVAIEELEATIELAKQQILKLKDGK